MWQGIKYHRADTTNESFAAAASPEHGRPGVPALAAPILLDAGCDAKILRRVTMTKRFQQPFGQALRDARVYLAMAERAAGWHSGGTRRSSGSQAAASVAGVAKRVVATA